jgi:8-oxo-dGTP pyrophosphatase MutT (NUDIX family)
MMPTIEITIAPGLNVTEDEIRNSTRFTDWVDRLTIARIVVTHVHVYSSHSWAGEPKMIYLEAEGHIDGRQFRRTVAFLRGDTVDMLAILECDGVEYAAFVGQPRIPGAIANSISNPSGMMEPGEDAVFTGLRELDEELGYKLPWEKPIKLCDRPLLVSPGGSDERAVFYVTRCKVDRGILKKLHNRFGGAANEGERTKVLVVPFHESMEQDIGCKTMLSLHLYQNMKNNNK